MPPRPTPPRPAPPQPRRRPPEIRIGRLEMSPDTSRPAAGELSVEQSEQLTPIDQPGATDGAALTEALRDHLDGPFGAVRARFRALDPGSFDAPPAPLPMDEHRARVTSQLAALAEK